MNRIKLVAYNKNIDNQETNQALHPVCPECGTTDTEVLDNEGVAICPYCWLEWAYVTE